MQRCCSFQHLHLCEHLAVLVDALLPLLLILAQLDWWLLFLEGTLALPSAAHSGVREPRKQMI
jgi:hypothetical protein